VPEHPSSLCHSFGTSFVVGKLWLDSGSRFGKLGQSIWTASELVFNVHGSTFCPLQAGSSLAAELPLSLKLFSCGAESEASLVAGLQPDCMEVTFRLNSASKAEFTLLCKAMEVQGQMVRAVRILNSDEAWAVTPFMASLRCCTGLRELK
jgi:hypothetical protein